jgi:hypothetical protein
VSLTKIEELTGPGKEIYILLKDHISISPSFLEIGRQIYQCNKGRKKVKYKEN